MKKIFDRMNKILSNGPLAVSCLFLLTALFVCMYGIWDIIDTLYKLENNPGSSGIDYLGIGLEAGSRLFIVSVLGLILSCVSKQLQQEKILQSVASAVIVIFSCLVVASVFLFFL